MMSFELKYLSKWEKISSLNPLYLIPISSNVNLIRNMTDSNDSLKFDIKYNFKRLKISEFYLVQKYNSLTCYISQTVACNGNLHVELRQFTKVETTGLNEHTHKEIFSKSG